MDTLEQRTRTEVINALATIADALRLILSEREQTTPRNEASGPLQTLDQMAEAQQPPKAKRAKKEPKAEVMPEVHQPDHPAREREPEPPVSEKMADIKPVKPGKTLADLRVALQECITKHGMPGAKERLAPFLKISDVPDDQIAATIERLAA
jgi:hypothetical protein